MLNLGKRSILLFGITLLSLMSSNLTWALIQTPEPTSTLDRNNLIGTWQCEIEAEQLAYARFEETFLPDQTYITKGEMQIHNEGKILIFNYEATAQWALRAERTLQIKNFNLQHLSSINANQQQIDDLRYSVEHEPDTTEKILRLNSKNLMLRLITEDMQYFPLKKCQKLKV